MLGLKREELAEASQVAHATLADFEAGKRKPYPRTLAAIRAALEAAGVERSMSRAGNCYDNAAMESFWARMQVELLNTCKWATTIELAAAMADYIDNFYNVERRHSYLGNGP